MINCPKCHTMLLPGTTSCACGWSEEEETQRQAPSRHAHDHRDRLCAFQGCPESGNNWIDGKWYCRDHLKEIKKQIELSSMTAETRQAIRELDDYAERNGIKRRPDETPQQHIKRCQQFIRQSMRNMIVGKEGE